MLRIKVGESEAVLITAKPVVAIRTQKKKTFCQATSFWVNDANHGTLEVNFERTSNRLTSVSHPYANGPSEFVGVSYNEPRLPLFFIIYLSVQNVPFLRILIMIAISHFENNIWKILIGKGKRDF